ncbi:SusC/RagA family TonB-linked outer membrane protein [Sphingobacterium sp.]|uniref:SusC/RagA family TonB-linked outer membrane protein n=1 Tax=Sphingobacterium sp. TaxID=341027 RepID=UPI0028972A8A|nr:SusC/RagA family TonB-linked outer membrane protein [Sphingobacterium sp.]
MKIKLPINLSRPLAISVGFLCLTTAANAQIRLHEKQTSLENVLTKIRKQSGYDFFFDRNDMKKASPVTVDMEDVSVMSALKAIFKDQPFDYLITDKTIMIRLRQNNTQVNTQPKPQQTSLTIKGKIIGADGRPLTGANLSVDATLQSFRTDNMGDYTLTAPIGSTVWVSYVGYAAKSFKILAGQSIVDITLGSSVQQLEEVSVSTGYQTLSKERVTGSFAKADMKAFSQRSASNDVLGRLEGLIPGLQVSQDFTTDANTKRSTRNVLIRGAGSVSLSNQPLYVVDGVAIADFSLIDINDIEDITVLKDAAAAAIWGARAANGVIVVRSKSGKRNEKLKLSYNSFTEFRGRPDLNYYKYLTSRQFIDAAQETFSPDIYSYNSFYSAIAPHTDILYAMQGGTLDAARGKAMLDSLSVIDNRRQIRDLVYQNAVTTNHNIAASGGTGTYAFYSSIGYNNERGSGRGVNDRTFRMALNQQYVPKDWLSLSLNAQLSSAHGVSKNPFRYTPSMLPYQLLRDGQGQSANMPYYGFPNYTTIKRENYAKQSGLDLSYRPLDEYDLAHSTSDLLAVNLSSQVDVKIWKGIAFKGNYSYSTSPQTTIYYEDHGTVNQRGILLTFTPADGSKPVIPTTGGLLRTSDANQRNWTVRNQLTYQHASPAHVHRVNIQLGQEASEALNTGKETTVLGWDQQLLQAPLLDYLTLKNGVYNTVTGAGYLGIIPYSQSENISRFNSYFALGNYMLLDKYALDLSWRRDHSNIFGSDVSVQNKPVYSIGGRWIISKERFMESLKWLDQLSVRATYGVTGNSPYAGSATLYNIAAAESYLSYPQIGGPSYYISQPANRKLSWEATNTVNLGLDFGLFKGKISGSIEYYNKKTNNLIGTVPNDLFTGIPSVLANIGEMRNNGLNLSASTRNIQRPNFSWMSSLIFAYNRNKLVKYTVPQSSENTATYRTVANYVEGYAMAPLFAYRYAGLDDKGDPQIYLKDGSITKVRTGAAVDDLVYMGTKTPPFSGGFGNTFNYKDLSLSLNLVYSFGAVMRNEVTTVFTDVMNMNNRLQDFEQRWRNPGDEKFTDVPSYVANPSYEFLQRNTNYYFQGDRNVLSASYLKLRDVTLSYNLPKSFTERMHLNAASVRVQTNNILLWANNKEGIDPEYYSFGTGARLPKIGAHSFAFGVNLTF